MMRKIETENNQRRRSMERKRLWMSFDLVKRGMPTAIIIGLSNNYISYHGLGDSIL